MSQISREHQPGHVLVTGGAGFIGSNLLLHMVPGFPEINFLNLDSPTYVGNLISLRQLEEAENYDFVHGSIAGRALVTSLFDQHHFTSVVHFAAESHVDRSIRSPLELVGTNTKRTVVLLEEAREERLIAGSSEIQEFVDMNGWHPGRGEDKDVFERLLAVRLDRILNCDECLKVLAPLDRSSLLSVRGGSEDELPNELDDDELLAELGISPGDADINKLRHVRSSADKRAAEEVASRTKCADFDQFQPLFDKVQPEITAGIRETRKCE